MKSELDKNWIYGGGAQDSCPSNMNKIPASILWRVTEVLELLLRESYIVN